MRQGQKVHNFVVIKVTMSGSQEQQHNLILHNMDYCYHVAISLSTLVVNSRHRQGNVWLP